MISVVSKNVMISSLRFHSSVLTRAPISPRLVRRRYSNGLVLLTVHKKGYKKVADVLVEMPNGFQDDKQHTVAKQVYCTPCLTDVQLT
jgi:hypothetical protein